MTNDFFDYATNALETVESLNDTIESFRERLSSSSIKTSG